MTMRLADLSVAKRRETVIIAARVILSRTAGDLGTYDLTIAIAKALGEPKSGWKQVGRILASVAPKVPQARRGEAFIFYGRPMQRWIWRGDLPATPVDEAATWEVSETPRQEAERKAAAMVALGLSVHDFEEDEE